MSPLVGRLAEVLLELLLEENCLLMGGGVELWGKDMRLGSMRGVAKAISSPAISFAGPKVGTVISFGGGGVCSVLK